MEQEKEIISKLNEILTRLKGEKTLMNLEAFCAYSGFSRSFVYKLTSSNSIPFYRPHGKLIMFEKSEVDNWLLQNRVKTQTEIAAEVEQKLASERTK